jgi:protein-disulfide isomerase
MERSTLAKWLAGLAIAVFLGFVAGRQQQILNNDQEILKMIRELRSKPQEALQQEFNLKIEGSAAKGNPDAKLVMVEFSDFECPFCERYVRETYPKVDRDYISTGKVRYVFRHFPLVEIHPHALKAGEAGECARRQDMFWGLHDRLFANPKQLDRNALVEHARATGVQMGPFETCLDGQAAQTVLADLEIGTKAGITGTPTFLLGFPQKDGSVRVVDRILGARPYESFQETLEKLLASPGGAKQSE